MRKQIRFEKGKMVFLIGDREVTREEFDRGMPDKEVAVPLEAHLPSCWPMRSEALACHPDQVQEMNERNAKHGIGTRYEADGTAVIPDRGDRKRLLRLEGYHDKGGGYGD